MDELEKELKEGFLQEAIELLSETEQAFLALENDANNPALLNKIFRFAHNLKGTSRAVGFGEVAEFTHEMENLILKIKEGTIQADNEIVSLLLECNDHINVMINGLRENLDSHFEHGNLIEKIRGAVLGQKNEMTKDEYVENTINEVVDFDETVVMNEAVPESMMQNSFENPTSSINSESYGDLSSAALESLRELGIDINRTEPFPSVVHDIEKSEPLKVVVTHDGVSEILTPGVISSGLQNKIESTKQHIIKLEKTNVISIAPTEIKSTESKSVESKVIESKKANTEETLRVSVSKVSKLNDLVGELVIVQTVLEQMRYTAIHNDLAIKAIGQLNKLSKDIQEMSMGLCLVPVKTTFQKMTRIVRDTSKALGKQVNLIIEGEETEIDRTVLEHLADPLVHIVRNAVDHGLESTEERLAAGKLKEGIIKIKAYHEGNSLAIEVSDDGKGINAAIIRKKAIEKKIISENENLSEKELVNLIFHAGFSTKDEVSEVSGRGVGMDVVKNNIQKVSGNVDIQTVVGKGSVFKITLPLTMAIIDGMIIQVGQENFVIPLDQVEESMTIKSDFVTSISGVGECMNLRGKVYPLLKIAQKLNLKERPILASNKQIAIIVNCRKHDFAVVVDDIIRQQQVVIKKIGDEVRKNRGLMGSTILGNGKPALILDLIQLFQVDEKGKSTKSISSSKSPVGKGGVENIRASA